ncbi:DUF262 domain-containing protein [Pontibacter toksunensis]|uniref:DUF262 domain-containing protein n=1 Tax=Pontibacter toksunensis TaxID=1332631 RepID=A0ABW6C2X4_9BACT
MKKTTKSQQLNLQLPLSNNSGEVTLPNAASKVLACKSQAEPNVVTPKTGSDEDDSEETETEPSRRNVISQSKDITVRELSMLHHEQDLILQPFYQRNFVVTRQVASRLVESLLLDIPIPAVFLSEEQDGTFSVIDGQQRLTSLISFLNGKFPDDTVFRLSGLKVLTDINKLGFEQLDKRQQRKIKNATLHTITFNKESNEEIKFDIFERYNTGVTGLNDDEIRNAIYRGPYVDLLKELSNNKTLHELLQQEGYRKRMKDRGLILRFLSLTEKTYMNYGPPMKLFLNKELRDNRYLALDKAAEFRKSFKHCLGLVKAVFGNNAFRRYIATHAPDHHHAWSRKFNTALFDLQMCGFAYYTKHQVMSKADEIREAMMDLMVKNGEFIDAIEHKIDNKSVLQKRFRIWFDTLAAIVGPGAPQKRVFPNSVKEALFKQHPYCAISGQKILSIDDAEVDHKISWKDGGPTTLENAQLVLRYFNREKGSQTTK